MRIRDISTIWMMTISGLVVAFACSVMIGGLFMSTSKQTITKACAGEFCIGQKKGDVDTVVQANTENAYKNTLALRPVRRPAQRPELPIHRPVTPTPAYDTYEFLLVTVEGNWGREKYVQLKFKNEVLIEIDITSYGPLSVS